MVTSKKAVFISISFALIFMTCPLLAIAQETLDENAVVDPKYLSGLKYRSVGPYRGGRVTAAVGVPGAPHLFYFGSTGGGVWKSDDAGESWANITDGQIAAGSIGAIAVAGSDPNVIYVGTGSACIRGNVSPGIGMYKSTDAGKTWSHIGLNDAGQIGRIRVHPKDSGLVYVAAMGNVFGPNEDRGIFRSRNGGETWEKILFIDEQTGAVDLSVNPANPRVLYASVWRGERKPWTIISGNEKGGLYKTVDGGDKWNKLSGGLPEGVVGRIGVAVSPARPDRVWALVEAEESGLYRSDDAGKSWRRVSAQAGTYERPWYYMHVAADPQDENTVWLLNVFMYKSVDGGRSFGIVQTPHPDNHDLWINPDDSNIMINGNDGGAAVTLNGGRTWSTIRNQPTAEIYRLTVDNQFPYRLYGAQQDNTTVSVPSRRPPATISDTESEFQVAGCESGHIAIDPRDPNIIYAGCYGGSISRLDRRTGQVREIVAYPQLQLGQLRSGLRYRYQWNAPIRISPHDPDVLYHTSQFVHRSTDGGQSWREISPDLTTNNPEHQDYSGGPISNDGTGVEVYGTIFALEESHKEPGVLWAGSDDGRLHISRNNGGAWTEITPPDLVEGATINSIDISDHNNGRTFITAYRYREADFRPYIFRTDDYGKTWTSLADGRNGIPADHFVRVVREDPDRKGLLYAGTEFGIYISFDDGAHWQSFQLNLPATPVTDIQVHEGDLILATQGRSFWILDDLTPLHGLTGDVTSAEAHLFDPGPAHRILSGGLKLGLGGRSAQNPPQGAILHYSIGEKPDSPIEIEIIDPRGKTVRTFSSEKKAGPDLGPLAGLAAMLGISPGAPPLPAKPGLYRYIWDLRYPTPRLPKGAVIFGILQGPVAPPGTYQVKMQIGDWSQTRELRVLRDPRGSATQADFDAQFDFMLALGNEIERLADKLATLRSAREQAAQTVDRSKEAEVGQKLEQIEEASRAIAKKLTALERELVQTKSRGFEDPLNYPGKLYAQLAHLQSVTNGASGAIDAPPTDGARQRLKDLVAQSDDVYGRLQQVMDTDVASLNKLVAGLNLPAVIIKKQ